MTQANGTTTAAPVEIFRTGYKPLEWKVTKTSMDFNIQPGKTTLTSKLTLCETPKDNHYDADLVLDGDPAVKLISIAMNGKPLEAGKDYTLEPDGKQLLVHGTKTGGSILETVVEIVPEENTKLAGLYKSGDLYCTQCEAMGFRRITFYPDRPDNMAIFESVRLEADAKDYPILLSNGNLLEQGPVPNAPGRHYAIWSDPYPKPSYLFACVAGDLGKVEGDFVTTSGRKVHLQVFSEHKDVHKLQHALNSLKKAMEWDQKRFGLEYDLDLYNIVAVDSFNMGAMENKGLNIFNTAATLAAVKTATDDNFERIMAIIAHEYFHNWTGNRVTCRDWFQLTLKEGLTVFRDQEFSADMGSAAVKRIEDVRALRGRQFREDASPMSHPIRPESYIRMDNFYTATVYEKGAEVIRMYQTLVGKDGFRKGMDLYFERHDGQAVTCDDFLAAMADANGVDLSQFARWYSTPGTPTVKYDTKYKADKGVFELTLTQSNKADAPLHIPVAVGLLDKATGDEVVPTKVLDLKEMTQTFAFDNLKGDVVPSLLRSFSAPVRLVPASGAENEEALAFLAARDTDGFNRWEAGQKLYTSLIFQTLRGEEGSKTFEYVAEAFARTLADKETTDFSVQAYNLILPSESTLAEEMEVIDPIGIHKARGAVKQKLARKFQAEIKAKYDELTALLEKQQEAAGGEYQIDGASTGRRRLRNVLLSYLCTIKETDEEQVAAAELATSHFNKASGMTDKMASLSELASMDGKGAPARDAALEKFYQDAEGDALVLNKWFAVQAMATLDDVLDRVRKLTEHPDFTLVNPNRLRALVGAFANNPSAFHQESGAGYKFISEMTEEVDKLNPQISSRLVNGLIQFRKYDPKRGALMKAELERLASLKLSEDLFEIVSRGLKNE